MRWQASSRRISTVAAERSIEPAGRLLLCTLQDHEAETAESIESAAADITDWSAFVDRVARHGVTPLVYRRLNHRPSTIPETALGILKRRSRAIAGENLRLLRLLLDCLNQLADAGIRAIPFKGPVLAATAYGDPTRREFVDLDLLVKEYDARAAKDVLESAGYRHSHDVTESQEAGFVRARHVFEMYNPDTDTKIELHWRLVPKNIPFPIDYERLWSRLDRTTIAGREVPILGSADRLLYLCTHGSWHRWEQLKWVQDVHRLLQTASIDWLKLLKRAEDIGGHRMLLLGCSLAESLLGTDLPDEVHRRRSPEVDALVAEVHAGLFGTDHQDGPFTPLSFRARTRERLSDRIRYGIRLATKPMPADFARINLGNRLTPLYTILRPLWLSHEYGRDVIREGIRTLRKE